MDLEPEKEMLLRAIHSKSCEDRGFGLSPQDLDPFEAREIWALRRGELICIVLGRHALSLC